MVKKFRESEVRQFLWGFGIFSALWILSVVFAGEIHLIDTIDLSCGSPILSAIFPFLFSVVLIGIACFSKRYGTKIFFKTSYVIATIPIVSTILGLLLIWCLEAVNDIDWVMWVLGLPSFFLMLVGIPAMSAVNAFGFWNFSFCIALGVFVLSLVTSMVAYLKTKEKIQIDREYGAD